MTDVFNSESELTVGGRRYRISRLASLRDLADLDVLPYSIKILLENLLRHQRDGEVSSEAVAALARWARGGGQSLELPFHPERVLLQDFTGVPAVVDLVALRDALSELGGDSVQVNPKVPVELIVDHSVIVDEWRGSAAFDVNRTLEFSRNRERYRLLRWAQQGFRQFAVVPPDTGICHQVNLEHLARVVFATEEGEAYPDTLVGTDSHTPMVNGIGVLGWGVGGIEAEAAMLGHPVPVPMPVVVGVYLEGELPPTATATDLVLTLTQLLRQHGVVGKFVEFTGPGLSRLRVEHRATLGNMAPEYGATCAISPIDQATLDYLRLTGRPGSHVELVEAYAREQGLFFDPGNPLPQFSELVHLDLSKVETSLAGPARPQDRVALSLVPQSFRSHLGALAPETMDSGTLAPTWTPPPLVDGSCEQASADSFPASDPPASNCAGAAHGEPGADRPEAASPPALPKELSGRRRRVVEVELDGQVVPIDDGHVVIAAITSCTNTSNPEVMVAAGLMARRAVDLGLRRKPWVKTSLAPGSRVVMRYLRRAGLDRPLAELGFNLVGYGCTTCIGNSGPLIPEVSAAAREKGLVVAAVLSGNRNFEGRIHPEVRLNYLASPPLVVAYALAGSLDFDFGAQPLGTSSDGRPVWLRDLWPGAQEIGDVVSQVLTSEQFRDEYRTVFQGDELWERLLPQDAARFVWEPESTYVRRPPFLTGVARAAVPPGDIQGARCLALLGDSVTTDHISPAGAISPDGPAGSYLRGHGVAVPDFNSFGSRRGNHEVMIRGTFANPRLRNQLVPGVEGGYTRHHPSGRTMTIYDASCLYQEAGTPLLVVAGRDYGSGSSRDWAAKGTRLLGVRAVVAQSFERIHRSNLVGMGVLPIEFWNGASAAQLELTGEETFDLLGIADLLEGDLAALRLIADGRELPVRARLDSPTEIDQFRHGGILPLTLRQLLGTAPL